MEKPKDKGGQKLITKTPVPLGYRREHENVGESVKHLQKLKVIHVLITTHHFPPA